MQSSGLSLAGYDVDTVPAAVLDHPGMTSRREKGMLYWLAKNAYAGEGLIVDAGLFLGASTNAFALGIKAGGRLDPAAGFKPIHSYDTAIWVRSMDHHLTAKAVQKALNGRTVKHGQSFLPILKGLLAPHLDLIDFRIGDIVQTAAADRPVEIAFYDCLKTAERDAAAFRAFGPRYVPGRTIVVQQDYFFEGAPDLKIRQEFLAPYFTYLGAEATSAVFRLDRPLPEAWFQADPVAALSVEEKVALLQQAAERTPEPKFRLYSQLAIVEFLTEIGDRARAQAQMKTILSGVTGRAMDDYGPRMAKVVAGLRKKLAA